MQSLQQPWNISIAILIFNVFFIDVWVIYSIVLVSGVEQTASYMCVCVCMYTYIHHFQIIFLYSLL